MIRSVHIAPVLVGLAWFCAPARGQVNISGRVVDETGGGIAGARVELRPAGAPSGPGASLVASSDLAGHFHVNLPAPGDYFIRAERLGFYLYQGRAQTFGAGSTEVTIVLNHLQDFSDRIDVTYSPPAIDPKQPAERKELDNTEIQSVPYPAPQDYRNALPLMDGVVQDTSGRNHVAGGDTNQTNYKLDGFNISDPVTGRLEARVNIDTIQSMELATSRFSAENGRGSAGVLDLETKMGDDRWRFGGTNFIPSLSTGAGVYFNKWTPRLELSGPLSKGRAWFYNGFDAFYSNDVVSGLPARQNRTTGLTTSDVSRFQVNLTPSNILTGSFLYNLDDRSHYGLSFLNPVEATTSNRQTLYMSTIRDQMYFGGGELLDVGFADSRGLVRDIPQGNQLYQITPAGDRGNYFVNLDRHYYRQQWIANLFLPTAHFRGTHQLKFGIDFEREAFHQTTLRHDYEVLDADNSVTRYVTFSGSPYQARKNFEGAQYLQDAWTPREGVVLEAGVRAEWNEIVRDLEIAPRVGLAWAPKRLHDTKIAAGWGLYYDSISLGTIARHQDQVSISTFYLPGGVAEGPVTTAFLVNEQALVAPRYQTASFTVERKLPGGVYWKSGYTHRAGNRGFTFAPPPGPLPFDASAGLASAANFNYQLANTRRERYDAVEMSVRHTFAGKYEWFAGYTRSSTRSNAAVEYALENPVFGPQGPGPFQWDTPNRFHMWGWAPLPNRILPPFLKFLTRNTSADYLVEYRTGFPFQVVDEDGMLVGRPNSARLPDYFNINLHLERQFRALHYLWAWRFGYNNLTNNGNPNVVNNVIGTPQFLTYGRGQVRAFSVRLRMLGRK
ncbi:MAG TPA: carboxypeptidase regulatory-like domain-containing protein [Bryobacteraceae bacterium]|nr:carboxypeptidase regulatory-like domain-containing protein [Bryobacteraceae bacterium]